MLLFITSIYGFHDWDGSDFVIGILLPFVSNVPTICILISLYRLWAVSFLYITVLFKTTMHTCLTSQKCDLIHTTLVFVSRFRDRFAFYLNQTVRPIKEWWVLIENAMLILVVGCKKCLFLYLSTFVQIIFF